MTTIHTLASGSSGNAAVISRGGVHILLDAGISCRRITAALRTLGLEPEELSAVFITHIHTDHVSGLRTLARKYALPIYASRRTCAALAGRIPETAPLLCPFREGEAVSLGSVTAVSFPTSHDAPGSCGYRFGEVGVLTDTGYVTEEAAEALTGVPLLVLEANHDVETLRSGPYPYALKQRVLGPEGHLSNEAAAAFALASARAGTREIVLAHLSRENNTPAMALNAVGRALETLDTPVALSAAPRDELSRRYQAAETANGTAARSAGTHSGAWRL